MKHLSLIVTLIFVCLVVACGSKKEKTDNVSTTDNQIIEGTVDTNANYAELIDDGYSDTTHTADTSKIDTQFTPEKGTQIDPPVENKEIKEVVPVNDKPKEIEKVHQTRYYIVAGSFKKYSNAQLLYDYFKNKGYKPLILPKQKGYNRVAIVSYFKEKEARTSLKKLRIDNHDIDFWLYKW